MTSEAAQFVIGDHMTEEDGITIRDYLDVVLSAKEQLLSTRLESLEKRLADTFRAMDKAIDKAEAAQREYNIRSNEFRGQLEDQAKTLMPRTETAVLMKTIEEKIQALSSTHDAKFVRVNEDLGSLRESRSEVKGEGAGREQLGAYIVAAVALLVSIIALLLRWQG